MSLAVDRTRIEGSEFARGMQCISAVYVPDLPGEGMAVAPPTDDHRAKAQNSSAGSSRSSASTTTSSSSIGQNSDSGAGPVSSDGDDSGEPEVQSSYRGPLDTMDSLEDSLPIRRGISKFYTGKSKSFTSLSDVAAAAVAKDLAKPENPYNRKRKNLILRGNIWENNRHLGQSSTESRIGIAKRPANFSRSSVAIDAMGRLEGNGPDSGEDEQQRLLPPLPPNGRLWPHSKYGGEGINTSSPQMPFGSRSFSLFDLQGAASSASRREKHDRMLC